MSLHGYAVRPFFLLYANLQPLIEWIVSSPRASFAHNLSGSVLPARCILYKCSPNIPPPLKLTVCSLMLPSRSANRNAEDLTRPELERANQGDA